MQQTQSTARLEALSPVFHVFVVGLVHLCEVHPPAEDAADTAEALAELATLLGSASAHTRTKLAAIGLRPARVAREQAVLQPLERSLRGHATKVKMLKTGERRGKLKL